MSSQPGSHLRYHRSPVGLRRVAFCWDCVRLRPGVCGSRGAVLLLRWVICVGCPLTPTIAWSGNCPLRASERPCRSLLEDAQTRLALVGESRATCWSPAAADFLPCRAHETIEHCPSCRRSASVNCSWETYKKGRVSAGNEGSIHSYSFVSNEVVSGTPVRLFFLPLGREIRGDRHVICFSCYIYVIPHPPCVPQDKSVVSKDQSFFPPRQLPSSLLFNIGPAFS